MRVEELAVVVDLTREVGILLAGGLENNLVSEDGVSCLCLGVLHHHPRPLPRICVPWSHW